jgi:ubiquinone/menaquinone biosynthesis C-methylase UbiE
MKNRRLEIGPGGKRVRGFETVNAIKSAATDHVADARELPFETNTFEIIYASHIIEHLPWYDTKKALAEWVRVLAPGGALEVWTIDAAKIAQALLAYEATGEWSRQDGWTRHGVNTDPYLWCNGRIFAYAREDSEDSVYWHRALFTPKYLQQCFVSAGLSEVRLMDRSEVRGHDHGWVNLGVRGVKP